MSVKAKAGNKRRPFIGVVVAGASKQDAISHYVAVASNQDAQMLQTKDGQLSLATLSSLSGSFRNVVTGKGNMVATQGKKQLQSLSGNASGDLELDYTICADGCGSHIVADNLESVSFCPSCSAALEDLSAEQIAELDDGQSQSLDVIAGNQGILVHASSLEEAEDRLREVLDEESGTQVSLSDNGATDEDGNLISESSAGLTFVSHSACSTEHSPFYGSDTVQVNDNFESLSGAGINVKPSGGELEVHYFQCMSSACGEHILSTSDTPVFCPSCSNVLLDPADVAELNEALAGTDSDDDYEDSDDDIDLDLSGSDEDEDEEDDFESVSFASVSYADDEDEEDYDDEDLDDEDDDFIDDDEDDFLDDDGSSLLEGEDDFLDDEDDEDDDFMDDEDDEFMSTSCVEMSLLTATARSEGKLDTALVALAYTGDLGKGDTWTAFYNHMPVATANVHNVKDSLRSIFPTAKYKDAVLASVREHGVQEGLNALGFEEFKPNLDVNAVANATIMADAQEKVDAALADAQNKEEQLTSRFSAALSTAAMGIARNAFKGSSNPIRDTLIASLSAAGVGNAQHLVDNAFASHSDSYAKQLITQAKSIVAKPLDVQNQLAETISGLNFASESSAGTGAADIGFHKPQQQAAPVQQQMQSESSNNEDMKARMLKLVSTL